MLTEGLTAKIKGEGPDIAPEDLKDRMGRLNYYFGQRVTALQRALRSRGLTILSAEAVHEAIDEDPNAAEPPRMKPRLMSEFKISFSNFVIPAAFFVTEPPRCRRFLSFSI